MYAAVRLELPHRAVKCKQTTYPEQLTKSYPLAPQRFPTTLLQKHRVLDRDLLGLGPTFTNSWPPGI